MTDRSDDRFAVATLSALPPLQRLRAIMERLRDPRRGCPWDVKQTFSTIAPYTIEEAYEVAEAIQQADMAGLKDELGDLLLQVVFHARMAEEVGSFDLDAVAEAICDKMIRRHPHVFADGAADTPEAVTRSWEQIKAAERAGKGKADSQLDGVTLGLPALSRAVKLQKRAAEVGFDWPSPAEVLDKLAEELDELTEEMAAAPAAENRARLTEEMGDVLFVVANLARHLKVDPEEALRACNAKFERRFRAIERGLAAEGRNPSEATLEEMESHWTAAKAAEKSGQD